MSKRREHDIHEDETMDGASEEPTVDQSSQDDPHEADTMDGPATGGASDDEAPTMDGAADDEQATVDVSPASSARRSQDNDGVPPGFHTVDRVDDEAATIESAGQQAGGDRDPALPKSIGRYRIIRLIGAGGMGAVFEAEQDSPKRPVALKLMKSGIVSRSALRRFEYESQRLGRLRHPGIAQVYEAGVHDDGTGAVPYFAMEYIPDAKTLTDYAQQQQLNTRQRLELFCKVCDAVHHGHQKGIIHRDLKPDNILVDSSGQPKIIDFGVARTTDSDIQATTVQTEVGQLVGTVPYMSPEQIEADPADIDTRSDVYGLGVVLYKLLTDKLPYDLSGTPVYEATRIIKEQAPLRLSIVNHSLKGDVETIVLHALEKDRDRRYQSALELEQDIERYLNDEPIQARPASLLYTWSCFARRNKLLVGSTAVVFVLLVGGVIGTTTGMVKANINLKEAREQLERAQLSAAFFIGNVPMTLDARQDNISVDGKPAGEATIADYLDIAVERVDQELGKYPDLVGYTLWSLGNGYRSLANFDKAEEQYRRALALQREHLEPPDEKLAMTMRDLGSVLWWTGKYEEAEPLFRESMEMYQQLAEDGNSVELARSIDYLAACLSRMERYHEAESLYRRALAMRLRIDTPVMVARTKNNLAMCLRDQKEYAEAATLIAEATDIVREHRGERHIDVANGLTNRASCLVFIAEEHEAAGDDAEAVRVLQEAEHDLREALDIKKEQLRADHTSIATTEYHLADVLLHLSAHTNRDTLAEAEQLARAALSLQQAGFNSTHPRVIDTTLLLERILVTAGDAAGAALVQQDLTAIEQQLIEIAESGDGDDADHGDADEAIRDLVHLYEATDRDELAQQYRRQLSARSGD